MIIGNNSSNNKNRFDNHSRATNSQNSSMPNSFENKWNEINKQNKNRPTQKNIFVKDIKEQKYSSASNTSGMQDKTLAMLHERLEKKLITLDEFNKKCAQLAEQRQNTNKKNKLF